MLGFPMLMKTKVLFYGILILLSAAAVVGVYVGIRNHGIRLGEDAVRKELEPIIESLRRQKAELESANRSFESSVAEQNKALSDLRSACEAVAIAATRAQEAAARLKAEGRERVAKDLAEAKLRAALTPEEHSCDAGLDIVLRRFSK